MNPTDTIKKQVDAMNRHDAGAYAALFSPDAVVFDPMYREPLRGREAIEKDMADFFGAFSDLEAEVTHTMREGDAYGVQISLKGTHTGPLVGPEGTFAPTHRRMHLAAGGFGRVDDRGQIVEERRYYDAATLLNQLGLLHVAEHA